MLGFSLGIGMAVVGFSLGIDVDFQAQHLPQVCVGVSLLSVWVFYRTASCKSKAVWVSVLVWFLGPAMCSPSPEPLLNRLSQGSHDP